MKLTFLGTGTSHGIPVISCKCRVCSSKNSKNIRFRSSIYIESDETSIIIDTTPEFRLQAIKHKIDRVDGVFYTHTHADHLHGIDDIRPLSQLKPIPLYGLKNELRDIECRFPYIFNTTAQLGGGKPNLRTVPICDKITLGDLEITPIPIKHGVIDILGYRINDVAYLTDCSYIPEESYSLLEGLDILIIGALRYKEHETHFNIEQSILEIKKIKPCRAFLTHMSHDVEHKSLLKELRIKGRKQSFIKKIKPAHDGLCLKSV